ncbi:MAG: porphobilinogen synthase [Chthoniobacterales bacterium]
MLPLIKRPRRLRENSVLREMISETRLAANQFIQPLFVSENISARKPIVSMPGIFQLPLSEIEMEVMSLAKAGVCGVLLFGIPAGKDAGATGAYAADGIVQNAVRAIKKAVPEMFVITDVCLCEYMSHGHCGIVHEDHGKFSVLNDASVEILAKVAVSHARAGADMIAPSDMMDGRIGAIRSALDTANFAHLPIMSYAAKFCSAMYGPFREAAESAPLFGDRRSYQMDPANALEALRETELDIAEGADIVMVKPGLPYLDILWRVKEKFQLPTAVYNVSGEYAMVKAAVTNGWLDERRVVLETMTAFRRAGADLIITYWAAQIPSWLAEQK